LQRLKKWNEVEFFLFYLYPVHWLTVFLINEAGMKTFCRMINKSSNLQFSYEDFEVRRALVTIIYLNSDLCLYKQYWVSLKAHFVWPWPC